MRGGKRTSLNNLLATFGKPGENRSLVLGGLTYAEFEKYAAVERSQDGSLSLALYAQDPVGKRVDPGTHTCRRTASMSISSPTTRSRPWRPMPQRLRIAQAVVLAGLPVPDRRHLVRPGAALRRRRGPQRLPGAQRFLGAVEEMECVAGAGF